MTHVEALDCPCDPMTVQTLGGGSAIVHRGESQQGERHPQTFTCPSCQQTTPIGVRDPFCGDCQGWHDRDLHAPGKTLLRAIEDEIRDLPRRNFANHTGDWIERAAVLTIMSLPERRRRVA